MVVVLPSGLTMPPLPYALFLVGGALLVGVMLLAISPPVDQKLSLALAPWIAVGGALHAFYQLGTYPPLYEPLFGAPAVYLTTFVVAGAVWGLLAGVGLVRGRPENVDRNLGLVGTAALAVLFGVVVYNAVGTGQLDLVWPSLALVIALVLTAVAMFALSLWRTPAFVRVRYVGSVVVFAHVLDGVSTAVGADVIGVTERTPIPAAIMSFAGRLPTAEVIGVGWLFVLVKVAIALGVVVAFDDYVRESPAEATLLLTFVAAVGLGPAANNLFLFLAGVA